MPDSSFWISLAVLGMAITLAVVQGRLSDRLIRLERKMDLLLRHEGIDPAPQVSPEVADLVRSGKKIEAIKAYREMTGASLVEAKERVEAIERGN